MASQEERATIAAEFFAVRSASSDQRMVLSIEDEFRRAAASLESGRLEDAERQFKNVLQIEPRHLAALNLLGIVLTQLKKYSEAEGCIKSALSINSNSDVTHYNLGIVLKAMNRPAEALQCFSQALALNPSVAATWNNRGTILNVLKRFSDAAGDFSKAISFNPSYFDAYCNLGRSLFELKRYDEALAAYEKALAIKPDLAEAWLGRGNVLAKLRRHDDALAAFEKALAVKNDLAEAWFGRGNVLYDLRRYQEGLAAYDQATALRPGFAEPRAGRGNIFADLKRHDEALRAYEEALALNLNLAEAWLGRGNVFVELSRNDDALAAYEKGLALKPDLAEAWLGKGNAFRELRHYDDAFAAFTKAIERDPGLANAWLGRGNIFYDLKRYDEAFEAFDRAVRLKPGLVGAQGMRLSAKMYQCNWLGIASDISDLAASVKKGIEATPPFVLLAASSVSADQLQCARRWTEAIYPPITPYLWNGQRYTHERLRVAYVSSDFRPHPMSFLIAGFIEAHDRSRFEPIGISLQPEDPSDIGQRMKRAFDKFIDVSKMTDEQTARLMRELEIDIAVDLNGYTRNSRTNIFARRPAPLQASYMGFPGTMGAEYIDYIIADETVIPADSAACYSEKIVRLPDTYWVADQNLAISPKAPIRSDASLPDGAFVFCCFNQPYKILPDVFAAWMRILKQVHGSVLWLLDDNKFATSNLKKEAERRDIDPSRLVFAPRVPLSDHLARHQCADLFIDTLPYNGHTTVSDALLLGLPVLTRIGETFAGRVAASLLRAIDLPELITASPQSYEDRAIELATTGTKLDELRAKLVANRLTRPLFDPQLFARHIEAGYEAMYERYRRNLPPDHISISH